MPLNDLDVSADEQAEWTSQMAQARFFRGLFHYYLYTTFNNGSIYNRLCHAFLRIELGLLKTHFIE